MTVGDDAVSRFYATGDLADRIRSALAAEGKRLGPGEGDVLAPADAFHIGGRRATRELAEWVATVAGERVLDVGCGIGGTCRFLASACGCEVVGVDVTEEYCRVAEWLSAAMGLGDRIGFRTASAADLPIEDGAFDVVWSEHVQMNVPDKEAFYRELARVLRPGGRYAFHEVFAGRGGEPRYPVPWAGDASISRLVSVADGRRTMQDAGLQPVRWEDRTLASAVFFRKVCTRIENQGLPPLGIQILLGPTTPLKVRNLLRNEEASSERGAKRHALKKLLN